MFARSSPSEKSMGDIHKSVANIKSSEEKAHLGLTDF